MDWKLCEEFLQGHAVFTGRELAAWLIAQGETGLRTQEYTLARGVARGRIRRIRKGLYATVPCTPDWTGWVGYSYAIAGRAAPDAVLSHITALECYGCEQLVSRVRIYTASRPRTWFEFPGGTDRGVRPPRGLADAWNCCEVELRHIRGVPVRVTSLARTLVDALDRPDLAGGWEAIWLGMQGAEALDVDAVVAYALRLGKACLCAKTGLFLEQHRDRFSVCDAHLDTLHASQPRRPVYMSPHPSRRHSFCWGGRDRLVKAWNLIVPVTVIERPWDRLWIPPELEGEEPTAAEYAALVPPLVRLPAGPA